MIEHYHNNFDPTNNDDQVLFRDGYVIQGRELNESQSIVAYRLKGIADALFKDGDVIRDARIVVNADTGTATCESGAIYLRGAVRGVPPAVLTVPVIGVVVVGVYLRTTAVTELDEPILRNPAPGETFDEPGAGRLRIDAAWGLAGDGQNGEFFPVYSIEDGHLRAKEPPPQLDSVTQALARYDRDSAGGSYVVSGLTVAAAADVDGKQVYTISEGRARVNGYGVELPTSRRLSYDAQPDLRFVDSEPHVSTGTAAQRITFDRAPVSNVTSIKITAERTVTLAHGAYTGAQDPLPDSSVLSIQEVKQGAVVYASGADYKLTAGKVDWSLSGAEPSTGSSYSVTYRYIANVTPSALDASGCTVEGAVAGTLVLVSYNQLLPRIDRLAISADGEFVWIKGVAADWNPQPSAVPSALLPIASVLQTWGADRRVVNDGVRVIPMAELAAVNARMDRLAEMIAQLHLISDLGTREAGPRRGLFVEPFLNDDLRDPGVPQTAAIVGGELTLAISNVTVNAMGSDVSKPTALAYSLVPVLEQNARTGSMKVNPYQVFDPLPGVVTLTPAVDRWTETATQWSSPLTERLIIGSGNLSTATSNTDNVLLSSNKTRIETLRPITVRFHIAGFGPGEALTSLTFDGLPVTPVAA